MKPSAKSLEKIDLNDYIPNLKQLYEQKNV